MNEPDIVIVGGGIAGGALATVLARAGVSVLVLERQSRYRDHVRGEILWPWGVRAARMVGVEQVLEDAGAQVMPRFEAYDEGADGPWIVEVDKAIPGIEGSLNITHPRACSALVAAAVSAGADARTAVRNVSLEGGKRRRVRWTESDGTAGETVCRLVVGADGRTSSVRTQAHIAAEVDPPAHLVAGMLVETPEGVDDHVNIAARERDLIFFSFPQQGGRSRLYLCFPTGQESRFAGNEGPQRFLDACGLDCLPDDQQWSAARPAGPCATFRGEDSRVLSPFADGVVLIGDAAGYENPLKGQGLSMAMTDAHEVSQALLSAELADASLEAYGERRAIRKRLADLATALELWTNEGIVIQDPAERATREEFIERDDVLAALQETTRTGFDALPQDLTQADLDDRLAAYG